MSSNDLTISNQLCQDTFHIIYPSIHLFQCDFARLAFILNGYMSQYYKLFDFQYVIFHKYNMHYIYAMIAGISHDI